jgi:hypothetical protein
VFRIQGEKSFVRPLQTRDGIGDSHSGFELKDRDFFGLSFEEKQPFFEILFESIEIEPKSLSMFSVHG